MNCESEQQVRLSKQVLERKAVWLKTWEVILAIEIKNDSHNSVLLISYKN